VLEAEQKLDHSARKIMDVILDLEIDPERDYTGVTDMLRNLNTDFESKMMAFLNCERGYTDYLYDRHQRKWVLFQQEQERYMQMIQEWKQKIDETESISIAYKQSLELSYDEDKFSRYTKFQMLSMEILSLHKKRIDHLQVILSSLELDMMKAYELYLRVDKQNQSKLKWCQTIQTILLNIVDSIADIMEIQRELRVMRFREYFLLFYFKTRIFVGNFIKTVSCSLIHL